MIHDVRLESWGSRHSLFWFLYVAPIHGMSGRSNFSARDTTFCVGREVSWKLNVDLLSKVGQAFCGELRSDFLHLESLMPLQSHSRTESVMPVWEPKSFRLERVKWNLFSVWKVGCDEIRQQPVYVWHGQPRLASSMCLMFIPHVCPHDRSRCRVHTIHPRGSEASQPDAWDFVSSWRGTMIRG